MRNFDLNKAIERKSRREFLSRTAMGIGGMALSSLLTPTSLKASAGSREGILGKGHFPAKVKRVIYLFQSGGPSQIELFDYKPALEKWHGKEIPDSIRGTQRNSGMVANQSTFPLVQSIYNFKRYRESRGSG